MRPMRRSSTQGPFLYERLKLLPLLPATPHDHAVGRLVLLARGIAQRRHAPGRDRMAAGGCRPLAAAMRVVDGVHRGAAGLGALALVAVAPRPPPVAGFFVALSPLPPPPMPFPPGGAGGGAPPPSSPRGGGGAPADRPICPPRPGVSSTLWTTVP